MRYWLFYGGDAQGPFTEEDLRRQPGFTQDALICPDGAATADEWKAARLYLSAAVSPRQAAPAAPKPAAAQPQGGARGADAEDLFDKLKRDRAQGGGAGGGAGAATAAAPAASAAAAPAADAQASGPKTFANAAVTTSASAQDAIDAMFAERRKAAQARAASKKASGPPPWLRKAALGAAGAVALSAAGWGLNRGWQAWQRHRALRAAEAAKAKAAAAAQAAAAPAAAPAEPMAGSAAQTSAPAPAAVPATGRPDAGMALAIEYAKNFPLQSRAPKGPADLMDLFAPARWEAPRTLGELYDQHALEMLGRSAQARLQLQGHDAAEAEREIKSSPDLWRQHAEAFLAKGFKPAWSARPDGSVYRVEMRRRGVADEEIRRFEVNPGAGTLKPLGIQSWFDVDPKQAAHWGGRYLRLTEEIDDNLAGPQTPTYAAKEAAAPPERPSAERSPARRPRAKAVAPAPKPKPKPADDEYDDPTAADDSSKASDRPDAAPPREEPAPAPAPKPAREASASQANSGAAPFTGMPQPAEATPSAAPPAEPPPSAAPGKGKGKKSVTDMSVDELERYLGRGKN